MLKIYHRWRTVARYPMSHTQSLHRWMSSSTETLWQRVKILHMPQLSPTMNKGSILKWHVGEGQEVSSYDLLLELTANGLTSDTEANGRKVSMDIEIIEDMYVGKILVTSSDQECKIGTPLAIFCDEAKDVQLLQSNNEIVSLFSFNYGFHLSKITSVIGIFYVG